MDLLVSLITFIACMLCYILLGHLAWTRNGVNRSKNGSRETVPEATGSWPIIGHLHLLAAGSQVPHKLFGSMADKFGPIFTIRLGVHRVLIVSNSEMAKECLVTNDRVFASRPKAMAAELMGNNYANFGFAPYGPYWRAMRKIIVLELLSHHRIQKLVHIRVSEVNASIIDMYTTWMRNKGPSKVVMIDMKELFGNLFLRLVLRILVGNYYLPDEDQLKKAMRQFTELFGASCDVIHPKPKAHVSINENTKNNNR